MWIIYVKLDYKALCLLYNDTTVKNTVYLDMTKSISFFYCCVTDCQKLSSLYQYTFISSQFLWIRCLGMTQLSCSGFLRFHSRYQWSCILIWRLKWKKSSSKLLHIVGRIHIPTVYWGPQLFAGSQMEATLRSYWVPRVPKSCL